MSPGKAYGEPETGAGHQQATERLLLSALVFRGRFLMNDGRWSTIREALDNWPKTARLCVIVTLTRVPAPILIWLAFRR